MTDYQLIFQESKYCYLEEGVLESQRMTMDLLLGKILVVRGMMPPSFANIHSDASILIIRSGDSAYASFQTRKL